MAKKGFIHLFLTALFVALISFFLLYFFAPSMSTQFLGVSFATRSGSDSAMVISSVDAAVQEMSNSTEFTKESVEKFLELARSAEYASKFKIAAKQGEDVVKDVITSLMEKVK